MSNVSTLVLMKEKTLPKNQYKANSLHKIGKNISIQNLPINFMTERGIQYE